VGVVRAAVRRRRRASSASGASSGSGRSVRRGLGSTSRFVVGPHISLTPVEASL